jgi:hypothetical protein
VTNEIPYIGVNRDDLETAAALVPVYMIMDADIFDATGTLDVSHGVILKRLN